MNINIELFITFWVLLGGLIGYHYYFYKAFKEISPLGVCVILFSSILGPIAILPNSLSYKSCKAGEKYIKELAEQNIDILNTAKDSLKSIEEGIEELVAIKNNYFTVMQWIEDKGLVEEYSEYLKNKQSEQKI